MYKPVTSISGDRGIEFPLGGRRYMITKDSARGDFRVSRKQRDADAYVYLFSLDGGRHILEAFKEFLEKIDDY